MARYLLLTFAFLFWGLAASAQQGSLQGTVTDAETGEPIIFGTVALIKNEQVITGTDTDVDGVFSITSIDPGTYDVEFSYTGYSTQRITGVSIGASMQKLDVKITAGQTLETVVVTYKKPLIAHDQTTTGLELTSEDIKKIPTRSVNALASLSAGVSSSDEGGDLNFRGSRADGTNFYLDGIRITGREIPKSEIENLQIITGGVEASYGDVTGGIVSLTSKGPSEKFGGGIELESSKLFDEYDHRLAALNLSGPILKRKGETLLGFRVAGQYQYNKDDDPPATSVYHIKDEVRQELEANPIRVLGGTTLSAGEFVDNTGVNALKYNPYEARTTYDLTGKLDANVGKNLDVTLSGTFYNVSDQFTPGTSQVFNSQNNPTSNDRRYRANFRVRHRLGGATGGTGEEKSQGSLIQNAVYTLQFGYEKSIFDVSDPRHGDNLFDYGYIGKYELDYEPSIVTFVVQTPDTTGFTDFYPGQVDYTRIFNGYTPGDVNPILTRYINNPQDKDDFSDFDVINGRIPTNLANVWNLHTNIGMVYNLNQKRNSDLYTFNANTSFQLVPKGTGTGRHNIQFGLLYEQRVTRGYDINPRTLWEVARLHSNEHLEGFGLDSSNVISLVDTFLFRRNDFTGEIDTIAIQMPIFAPGSQQTSTDNLFFKSVREKLGVPLTQYVNIDALDPSFFSLDMFSARELNDEGIVNYWGYDYLGNQLDGLTFDDFFTHRDGNGIRDFPVAANRPNYQSAFIQDKFTFKDIIFRVGLRVERFDANSKTLKDPYSLYDIMKAQDFSNLTGAQRPSNIGDDFKVYVSSDGGDAVTAYRDGDTWYFPSGAPANDGTEIFGGGLVVPRYAEADESKRDVTNENFVPSISFEDYKPQINWMPRLAFSFPISDEAGFFAHYDVLVQRPPGNNFVSPLTYFYWETGGSGIRANANLKPERTVDYEVGFQQKLSESSALKISAYYKELRDMIQSRFFLHVPAPVNQYETYDNLDFGTVKGFSVAYDLRRTKNISLNLAYTLQFADGTGSDANSSRGLSSRGIQRTLFPISYDERHTLVGIVDFRYLSGDKYNGPSIAGMDIFANMGLNITGRAVSGRPYTAAIQPDVLGSSGIIGAINGSRLPWNMTMNINIDKSFTLTKPDAKRQLGLNVYVRISNVLDRRNIISVYRFTGSPTDDGFLNSVKGQSFINGGVGPGQSLDAYLASYQWRLLNADNYSIPRRVILGATFDF